MPDMNEIECDSIPFEPITDFTLQRDQNKICNFFNLSSDELAVVLGIPSESLSITELLSNNYQGNLSGKTRMAIDMQIALLNAAATDSPENRIQAILIDLKKNLCLTNCICAKLCHVDTKALETFLTTGNASDSDKYKICIGCLILRSLWDSRDKSNPKNL